MARAGGVMLPQIHHASSPPSNLASSPQQQQQTPQQAALLPKSSPNVFRTGSGSNVSITNAQQVCANIFFSSQCHCFLFNDKNV